MSISDQQIQIINNVKNFLKSLKSSNIDFSLSSFCYFTSWAETPGYARLKLQANGWFFIIKFCTIILKNIFAIASHTKYVEFGKRDSSIDYEIIILSWSFKKNFQADGSFHDRYFNENSKNLPNSYWILISMDDYVPENLNNNIRIIKNKKGIFKYNFFSFAKILISIIIDCRFSPRKMFHYLSFHSYFAKLISAVVKRELKKSNYKAILLPYEAQPFQNKVFLETKNTNNKIMTLGYLHSLSPLTCELIYRSGAPDFLFVHGESQIEMLKSKLNWPENKLLSIRSLRFRLNQKESLSKKIFIPLSIHNCDKFLKEFKKLLINSPTNNFPKFDVKNHPTILNSKKHLDLKNKLEKIMEIYKDRFSDDSPNQNISVFFGVTAAVLEALEKGINVIHICSDPIFQSYSEKIWPNFKVKQISKFVFHYNLTLSGKLINFSNNKTLNQTLKTLF